MVNLGSEFDATNDLPGHPYVNGLYEVGYSVEPLFAISSEAAMRAATVTRLPLIESEKLPNEWSYVMPELPVAELDHMLRFVYRQSFTYDGRRHDSVFNYTVRKLYYTVTNAVRGEPDSAGAWHTAEVRRALVEKQHAKCDVVGAPQWLPPLPQRRLQGDRVRARLLRQRGAHRAHRHRSQLVAHGSTQRGGFYNCINCMVHSGCQNI